MAPQSVGWKPQSIKSIKELSCRKSKSTLWMALNLPRHPACKQFFTHHNKIQMEFIFKDAILSKPENAGEHIVAIKIWFKLGAEFIASSSPQTFKCLNLSSGFRGRSIARQQHSSLKNKYVFIYAVQRWLAAGQARASRSCIWIKKSHLILFSNLSAKAFLERDLCWSWGARKLCVAVWFIWKGYLERRLYVVWNTLKSLLKCQLKGCWFCGEMNEKIL